ncbi:MAG: hypothetical protein ACKOWH_01805 [Rhodoluna sp.]
MDFIALLYVVFIVIYAVILGLVMPYVGLTSDRYGSFVPTAIGVVFGALLWGILTWTGLHYDQAWIWLLVMLLMPAAMWFGAKRIEHMRSTN